MNSEQYQRAEDELITTLQRMRESEGGHVILITSSTDSAEEEHCLDDVYKGKRDTERSLVLEEFQSYCNVTKKVRYRPKTYSGPTLKLGPPSMVYPIVMGKVETRGDDIKALSPFVSCNLADFIGDDGRFNLVNFLQLQRYAYPTIYKLAVKFASIRTNEVGCERFFSTAGYVSNPRRTSLNIRNYECLATLRSNMQKVYLDEGWVVDQYLTMEKNKNWDAMKTSEDMNVLNLERDLLAESHGISTDKLPPVTTEDIHDEESGT